MSADLSAFLKPAAKIEWETPQAFFDALDAEFGFTLDVCALPDNAKCARFFSPDDDGLSRDWGNDVCWMNPPYGPAIKHWMRKAFAEAKKGATVVCLIPARTDTAWWHDYAEKGERRFIRGRLKFGGHKWNAPFPNAVVVFRPSPPIEANWIASQLAQSLRADVWSDQGAA